MLPKVLVGAPVSDHHEYCTEEFIKALKQLNYSNYDILLVDNSKEDNFINSLKNKVPIIKGKYFPKIHDRLIHNRNILRQKALDEGYDYFLNIDQDVIPPKDIIQRMLKHRKKIVTGIYFNPWSKDGKTKLIATIWRNHPTKEGKMVAIKDEIIQGDNIIKIDSCGSGCLLIHKDVLQKIKFRYDLNFGRGVDDVFFCLDAKKEGFQIYADTSIKCKHLITGRQWSWDDLLSEK